MNGSSAVIPLNIFWNVARLMYIYALEEHLELPKELIYAAALLHDIGRAQQYQYKHSP